MADALYIVTRNEQDQYVRLLNLDEAGVIFKARDSWKPTIAGRQPVMVQAEHRRGASTMVAERRDTGSVGGTFMVKGATADAALTLAESLLAQADSAGRDRWLWWLPSGATYPTLFPLVGPGSASVNWSFPMFLSGFVPVDVTWPAQAWTEEPVLDFSDDFRARDVGVAGVALTAAQQFTQDYTTSVVPTSVVQGALEIPNAAAARNLIRHQGRRAWQDGWVTVKGKAKTGAATINYSVTPGLRYTTADGKYFFATLESPNLTLYEWTGSATSRGTAVIAPPAVGTDYWMRIRAEGASVTAEYWSTQPTPHGTPTGTVTYTNAANVRTGYPLLHSFGMASNVANIAIMAGWDSRPYSYRLLNTPTTVTLPDLPGTAPAAVDVDLTASTGDSDYARHLLLGWRRAKASEFVGSFSLGTLHSSLLIPGETGANVSGAAVVSDAAKYRGGSNQAMGYTTTALAGSASAVWYFDPTAFPADDFASTTTFGVFVRYWRDTTIVTPRLTGGMATPTLPLSPTSPASPFPEFGSTGRYLPTTGGAGVRSTFLGTLTTGAVGISGVQIMLNWAAGSAAAVAFAVDEVYLVPLASLALGATGKNRDDGTYSPAMLAVAQGRRRRVRSDLSGALALEGAGESLLTVPASYQANMGGAPILMPTESEGVELLVRPSVSVPDDPVSTATDILTHNVTVHARVTPRHHLFSA